MSSTPIEAQWFDGQRARAQAVRLHLDAAELCVVPVDATAADAPKRYAQKSVTWPERTRHGVRQLLLPDGGVLHVADGVAWDSFAKANGLDQPLAARWALSWRSTVLAAVMLVTVLAVAGVWGIPWAAERSAKLVPQSLRQQLDDSVISQIQRRGWLKPSELSEATALALQTQAQAMLDAAYTPEQRPQIKIEIHRMPNWMGPNAFALPGGRIIITDALLELLPLRDGQVHPGVMAVVAHEIGHVKERHGLQMVLSSGATGILLGWWIGDYSSIMAGAPALMIQASYSRDFEREADDEALRILRAAGIDPRGMVEFFAALKKAQPQRDGDDPHFGLATHPPDSERVRLFQTGER